MRKTVGNFVLDDLLGKGSISSVYAATDGEGRTIALKLIQETPFIEKSSITSILDNAEATRRLPPHPKIVQVLDFGKIDDYYFVSMERINGPGTLEQLVAEGPLDLGQALRFGQNIASALTHAHGANLVHGDLKPGNILINDNSEAILNDFCAVSMTAASPHAISRARVGTPKYMSPQQARGLFVSRSSDVYSFGVVLYELLTGQLPYDLPPATNLQVMADIISETPPIPARKLNRKIPRRLNKLLMALLEKEEEFQCDQIGEVEENLKAIIESLDRPQNFWERIRNEI